MKVDASVLIHVSRGEMIDLFIKHALLFVVEEQTGMEVGDMDEEFEVSYVTVTKDNNYIFTLLKKHEGG